MRGSRGSATRLHLASTHATPVDFINRQILLAARPVGMPKESDWELAEGPAAEPGDGEVVVRAAYLSIDPAMRGWMNDRRSYTAPVAIGAVMRARGAGEVVVSRDPGFSVGDRVSGPLGIQEYATLAGHELTKVDTALAPLPVWLNVLGIPGLTAYFGLLDIGRPEPGDTVVVSGAAGAVGGLAGQIAKLMGCRAVGIAGGSAKCRHVVDELGFDAATDYKGEDVGQALRRHCPDGIDVYFDNVGGEILDAALSQLAMHARVVICGAISQYNGEGPMRGPSNYMALLVRRASMTGFLAGDFADRYVDAVNQLSRWLTDGKLKSVEDYAYGLENFPDALLRLFRGDNLGKLILAVAET